MDYDFRLAQTGIKKIHYYGNPILGSLQSAIFLTCLIGVLYKYVLAKFFLFFDGKEGLLTIGFLAIFLISFFLLYKKRKYIQWDQRNIRFKDINGYTAIIGVDKIQSIKINKSKGIYITHDNFIDEKRNGTYLIPFDRLGRNYNTDVEIITEDFKKLYSNLIIE
ncbi:MAG TPA: hypothetical protein VLZ83_12695 [Edaphocola sp.]|nr:hypothetical protein [Edaphocola sp.]